MKVSSNRLFLTVALALIAVVTAVALFPLSTQAAGMPYSSANAPAPAWYGSCAYTVADGDDLFHIAMRYGVSPYSLATSNRLYNPNFIYRGMVMQVPCVSAYPSSNYRPSVYPGYRPSTYPSYRPSVYPGYQSSGYPGYQSSGYPSYQPSTYSSNYQSTSYSVCNTHFVQRGEWLNLIAMRYGVPWQSIAAMNRLYNPNFVFAGERLLIPCAQAGGYSPYSAPSSGYSAPSSGYPTSPSVYPAPSSGGTTPPPTAGSVTDMMQNIMFNPATITIHVGQSVVWRNMDSVQHSATQGTCSGNTCSPTAGGFDTGILNPGQTSGAITFNTAGTFHFYCRVHGAMMQGDVVVTP